METRHRFDERDRSTSTALSEPSRGERGLKAEAQSHAEDAKQQVTAMADMGREEVAGQLEAVSRAFRTSAEQLRTEGQSSGPYVAKIGEQADRAARYLRERDAAALTEDASTFARAKPALFLGGCALAGFAIGRFLTASPPKPETSAIERRSAQVPAPIDDGER